MRDGCTVAGLDDDVRSLLPESLGLAGREVRCEPLPGGLTNRNFRLDVGEHSFVLRIGGANTALLGIDRERELACLRVAAAAGVGPEVVALLPEHQILITRFLPGNVVTPEAFADANLLKRVAAALRRCHEAACPAELAEFCPFTTIRSYYDVAKERQLPFPATIGEALRKLDDLERRLHSPDPPCLCHNDLLPTNFIDDGVTIHIIDWEYGGRGDRFFDLGNLATNLQWNVAQEEAFLEHSFGTTRPGDLERLRGMRMVSDLREALWGFLQSAISTLHTPTYYLAYGQKHLERFLAA